ncbi:serine/threonine-protein kinase RIO2-like [Oppia nitens]|uniref:serine/threonine-protein kinase RIO2-like n=1 Tax=Oppia nitens TaxID=1686743 RepID=UPI0023D99C96|nr:serine/threonine-protein kinase RIO2-like [Oppia nitens]
MVKLDVSLIRYMTADEVRLLTAVEMGMKNHELVPKSLVVAIARLRGGSIGKVLLKLTQSQLLSYERGKRYDGYRLTYRGYDLLALNALANRQVIASVGNQIGVGKESDVYMAADDSGRTYAVKMHRLGRTCFRTVSTKRDYQRSGGHKTNWLYLSRLAAKRELAFMRLLYDKGVPIPEPFDCNRHCLVMELIDGILMNHLTRDCFGGGDNTPADADTDDASPAADGHNNNNVEAVKSLYDQLMSLIVRLANEFGVVHGDFNEFNIIVKLDTAESVGGGGCVEPVLIDFPQMISVEHESAETYFQRDVNCIVEFFAKRFAYESDFVPTFDDIDRDINSSNKHTIDVQIDDDINSDDDESEDIIDENEDIIDDNVVDSRRTRRRREDKQIISTDLETKDTLNVTKVVATDVTTTDDSNSSAAVVVNQLTQDLKQCLQLTEETKETILSTGNNDDDEEEKSDYSFGGNTSVATTFTPQEIKGKLQKEKKLKDSRVKTKKAKRDIKGDNCALNRRKKDDLLTVRDDIKTYHSQRDLFN